MKISIGSDHAGFLYKEAIIAHLNKAGHEVTDYGTHSADSTDYPLYVIPAAEAVARKEVDRGIVLGGSGNGGVGKLGPPGRNPVATRAYSRVSSPSFRRGAIDQVVLFSEEFFLG